MTMKRFELNPRVSIFRHKGGIYLFDPYSRSCASMSEEMLGVLEQLQNSSDFLADFNLVSEGMTNVVAHLRKYGILIDPEDVRMKEWPGKSLRKASMNRLVIFVTTNCNLRCIYCYAHGGENHKTIGSNVWKLAMKHFFETFDDDRKRKDGVNTKVSLTLHGGGEATLEFAMLKEIVADFLAQAKTLGLNPSITIGTNGTYSDTVHDWIVINNIQVTISLDGKREIQNYQRPFYLGTQSFDIVTDNLRALVAVGSSVAIRTTVTAASVGSMQETVELARELGITSLHFEPVTLIGRGSLKGLSRPDPDQFADMFLKCFLKGLEYDIHVKYSGLHCFSHCRQSFCSACGQNFCVTPEGNITTCYEVLEAEDPAASTFFIGKVDTEANRVEWDYAQIEALSQRTAYNMDACKDCFLRYQCAGDCPVKGFRYSGENLYTPDTFRCKIAELVNKQLIAWLADDVIKPCDLEGVDIFS